MSKRDKDKAGITFSKGKKADEVTFKREAGQQPSKYDDLVEAACAMKHKETIIVNVPPDRELEKFRVSIRQALNRYIPEEVAEKKRFEVRTTIEDQVAIVCYWASRE